MENVDFTYYSKVWNGELSEDKFLANSHKAKSFVDYVIGHKSVRPDQENAYKRAVCAAIDTFDAYGYEETDGFRIGDFTVPSNTKSGKQIAHDEVCRELSGTGLLWSGLR